MAQYDLLLTQNVHASGIEFSEKNVNITKGALLSSIADGTPTVLAPGTNGYQLVRDDAEVTGLKWVAITGGHTQGTDTGTTSTIFELDSDGFKIELTAESAAKMGVKVDGGATYADLQVKDLVCNDLTVNGTNTIINSTTLTVDDKNIELGSVTVPSDITADGGGITLKGATDKTILWDNTNDNWSFNQAVNISSGLTYKINNVAVLSATQVLGKTLGTMSEAATTDYIAKALYDANSVLFATADNTPQALTVGASTVVGRKASGDIVALTPVELANVLCVAAPATKTSTGTAGQIAFDTNFMYRCTATDTWKRTAMATNWS